MMKAMRLCILSRGPQLYSTQRLVKEAEDRGAEVEIVDPLETSLVLGEQNGQVIHRGWPIETDAVIPRIGYSVTSEGVRVVRQFESQGIYVANSADSILRSRDKLTASQILSHHGIPVPRTALVTSWRDTERAISRVGGVPCVIKASQGTQGNSVHLARSIRDAREHVYRLLANRETVLVQEYIRESHGRDVRVIVAGGEVVAAMRRVARGREFRSNFHLGGQVEAVELKEDFAKVAVRAASLLGIEVGGVDLLEGRSGPILLEVNSSPGLEGIERASKVNVAGKIIDMISQRHRIQSTNLQEVIRHHSGHGALTIRIKDWPEFIGRRIKDVRMEDSRALTVLRGKEHIWSPDENLVLQPNDELVLYGEIVSIRAHMQRKNNSSEEWL